MNTELIAILAIFITMILGFLGVFIMMFQQNQQINSRLDNLRTEIKQDISKLDNDIKISNAKLSDRIDKLSDRMDRLYEMMIDLYKYFVKKDAA